MVKRILSLIIRRFDQRPPVDSYCEALYPFCPTGDRDGRFPSIRDSDAVSVYRLQTPVWEFKYGDALGKFVSALSLSSSFSLPSKLDRRVLHLSVI